MTELAPWAHQDKEFKENRSASARALLWSMRTGKSRAIIDKACFQFQKRNIKGVIVFAPNGVHENWVLNEIPRWSWPEIGPVKAFAWSMPKRGDFSHINGFQELIDHDGLKWFSVNMESIRYQATIDALNKFKLACGNDFMLAISELHHFGYASAKRTRKALQLATRARYVMGETGTPLLASPLRAYAMFKILRRGKPLREDLASYEDFVKHFANIEMVAEDGGKKPLFGRALRKSHKKITGYRNLDELRDLIAPYCSVVLRDDVEDMPDLIEVERPIVMSEKQRKAYLEMVSRHLVDLDAGLVTAKDAGPRMMKLQQILNGYIIDSTTGEIINVDDAAPIYEALVEEVNGTLPGKTIVWCRYHEDVDRCIMALRRAGHQCLQFDGRVPQSRRESIRLAFNNDPRYTVVVGHPGAGGEGRDFSEADCIIYFSSTPNAIHVAQGRERGTAKGKLKPITIVRFHTHGTVDDRNWKLADGKFVVADSVSGQGLRDVLMATDV